MTFPAGSGGALLDGPAATTERRAVKSPAATIPSIAQITALHRELCRAWHTAPVEWSQTGFLGLVAEQFSYNFLLWHEEDIARSRDVPDARIAEVKRAIDRYNQKRNDFIEQLDDWLTAELERRQTTPAPGARQNTETAGSTIDRLSILTLRIYHLEEQRDRTDAAPEHRENATRKLAVALVQHDELSQAAQELFDDLLAGRKRHRTYRQLKLYNDPAMNPYLYRAAKSSS